MNKREFNQRLRTAPHVFIHLAPAATPASVCLRVTKASIRDFIRDDGADPEDEELWLFSVGSDGTFHIHFQT